MGSRGYPSSYGGFETLVRHLAPFLVENGHHVAVYNRGVVINPVSDCDRRVQTLSTSGINRKTLSTLTFGVTSALHARRHSYDVALVLNPANGYILPLLRNAGIRTAVNVDGLEWQRAKWNALAKLTFYEGARMCSRYADQLIYDSDALRPYWAAAFGVTHGAFIPYGASLVESVSADPILAIGLEPKTYILVVSRLVPENSLDLLMRAGHIIDDDVPIVIVGTGGRHDAIVKRTNDFAALRRNVYLLGHVSDQCLLTALWHFSGVYWHGHSVGGTNPGLLQAMGAGAPTLALDTPFNSEVLALDEQLVAPDADLLATRLSRLLGSPSDQDRYRLSQREQIEDRYQWVSVCRSYESLLCEVAQRPLDLLGV